MISLHNVLAVARFEIRRSLTATRLALLAAISLFPPVICLVLVVLVGADMSDFQSSGPALVFYYLIPGLVCLLGMLQWSTPAIHAELEGRTWGYLAIRPHGSGSVLIGKYLAAVLWTTAAAAIALTLSLAIAQPRDLTWVWLVYAGLSLFSALSYGALFLLLGVLFLKRAPFIAVAYIVLMEVLVSLVPATVNELTIQYRLRGIMYRWLNVKDLGFFQTFFSDTPAWLHLAVLGAATATLLIASLVIVSRRQFVSAEEART